MTPGMFHFLLQTTKPLNHESAKIRKTRINSLEPYFLFRRRSFLCSLGQNPNELFTRG
jgi:hypothetical protein